jgi:hypothetical protein
MIALPNTDSIGKIGQRAATKKPFAISPRKNKPIEKIT